MSEKIFPPVYKRNVKRWPMTIAYNAYVKHSEIYRSYNAKLKYKRTIFLAELWETLVSKKIIRLKTGPQGREAAKLLKYFQSHIL